MYRRRGVDTLLINEGLVLYVLRPDSKANACVSACRWGEEGTDAYFSVLRVSCRNLVPGARLQMRRPTELPPRASCRMRVSFELRYGMRL